MFGSILINSRFQEKLQFHCKNQRRESCLPKKWRSLYILAEERKFSNLIQEGTLKVPGITSAIAGLAHAGIPMTLEMS